METKERRPAAAKGAQRAPSGRAPAKTARRRKSAASRPVERAAAQQPRRASAGKPRKPSAAAKAAPKTTRSAAAAPRRTPRQRRQETAKERSMRRAESQVVYTPPKTFNRLRFLLAVLCAAAVVLAVTLGMSIFFKVATVTVSGSQKYSAWDVQEASGIQVGDNLLTLGKAKVSGKIIARLPYVEKVRIGIKLPDTVNIEVTEAEVYYAIQAEDSGWWFINAQGRVLEMTTGIVAEYFTKIEGVRIAIPEPGQQAIASTQMIVDPTGETEETQPAETEATEAPTAPVDTVNGAEQLNMALAVLQHLENNGIIGEVSSVNVADLYNMELRYDDRYQVFLGDGAQLDRKVRSMREAIMQMTDYQQGTLDVSFTIWPDKVGYTPVDE